MGQLSDLNKEIKEIEKYLPDPLQDMTPIKRRFLRDWDHRFFVVTAGRRSGKTHTARHKLLERAIDPDHINHRYFHAAPTQDQAGRIFWEKLKRDYKFFITKINESKKFVRLYNGTEIWVIGLDKPQRFEGAEWHGGHITEMADIKERAIDLHIMPGLADTKGFLIMDGVPEGMNHYYDLAVFAAGGALPETVPYHGAFAENPDFPEWCYYSWFSSDVLDPREIQLLQGKLDERTAEQELGGKFVTYAGLAYYGFSRENIRETLYDPGRTVHIGMDFNVNPMTAVFTHINDDSYREEVNQFGEAYLEHSDTYEMVDHIDEYFNIPVNMDYREKREKYIIYPDSTGRAKESNAKESDLEILRRAGFGVMAHSKNPRIKDRINSVNSMIAVRDSNREIVRKYFVDPSCKRTIEDLRKVERLNDGRENKKQEEYGLVHISSSLGYLISYRFPFRRSVVSLK